MRIVLAASSAEHSPFAILGGAVVVLGLVMTTLAPRERYVDAKLDKLLGELGFVAALLGGIALIIGAALELGPGHSRLGSITLLGVAIGIVLILVLPNLVGCRACRKRNRVGNCPDGIPAGKPPTLRRDDDGDNKVGKHERCAVEREVPESESEARETRLDTSEP